MAMSKVKVDLPPGFDMNSFDEKRERIHVAASKIDTSVNPDLAWTEPVLDPNLVHAAWKQINPIPYLRNRRLRQDGKEVDEETHKIRREQIKLWHAYEKLQIELIDQLMAARRQQEILRDREAARQKKEKLDAQRQDLDKDNDVQPMDHNADKQPITLWEEVIFKKFIKDFLTTPVPASESEAWKIRAINTIDGIMRDLDTQSEAFKTFSDIREKVNSMKANGGGWLSWMRTGVDDDALKALKDTIVIKESEGATTTYMAMMCEIALRIMNGGLPFCTINGNEYTKDAYRTAYNAAFQKAGDETSVSAQVVQNRHAELDIVNRYVKWCRQNVHPALKTPNPDMEAIWNGMVNWWDRKSIDLDLKDRVDCDHAVKLIKLAVTAHILPINLKKAEFRGITGAVRGDIMVVVHDRLSIVLPLLVLGAGVQQIGNMAITGNTKPNMWISTKMKVGARFIEISAAIIIAQMTEDEVSDYNSSNLFWTWAARFTKKSAWGIVESPNIEKLMDIPESHIDVLVSKITNVDDKMRQDQRQRATDRLKKQRIAWTTAVVSDPATANSIKTTVWASINRLVRQ